MQSLLNLLWIIFGGWVIWLEYMVSGLLLCLTVVGIPFGMQCFKLAWLGLVPFGKVIEDDPNSISKGGVNTLLNLLWLIPGILIFLSHLAIAAAQAVTLIGIPFAIQHFKLGMMALAPFGKRIRNP